MRRIGGLVISRAACSVLPSTRRQTRGGIPVRHQIEESGNDSKKFRGQIALTQESARWRVRRVEGGSVAAFSTASGRTSTITVNATKVKRLRAPIIRVVSVTVRKDRVHVQVDSFAASSFAPGSHRVTGRFFSLVAPRREPRA